MATKSEVGSRVYGHNTVASVLRNGGCGDKEKEPQGHIRSPSLHWYKPVVSKRQSARLREERSAAGSSRPSMEAAVGGKDTELQGSLHAFGA